MVNRKEAWDLAERDVNYCPVRAYKEGNSEHDLGENYFGDMICSWCQYAPNGHKSIDNIMVQLPGMG